MVGTKRFILVVDVIQSETILRQVEGGGRGLIDI